MYQQIFRFWRKIFAVGFGLGVVAGTVMTLLGDTSATGADFLPAAERATRP
ncbi:cytochrome ubiquinol oxidase subunit I [Streptacidiphilus anmyonensis]|uniref:cytochrome ubiquinol oxidase subunit I n=1 Tax=Streptacidiphilus anmyonensis TaxID=405782 RepID=UPI0022A96C75|nr:hypothetical protein [Streptacidiphilus anmyonensis]